MSKVLYDDSFYGSQVDRSYGSALKYVHHLSKIFVPRSVADLGCGRGAWLKAFGENGAVKLVGFDGNWNTQEKMLDQKISFVPVDLNGLFTNSALGRFDLAMSVEVAEHLKKQSAENFVSNITSLSDVIMFGAAYENQGGTDHVNEQPHTYWAKMFISKGYVPYDLFRAAFWGNRDVEFFYQQNTFLYVKETSDLNRTLQAAGYPPISNIEFMNCVHPKLYNIWVSKCNYPIKTLIRNSLVRMVPRSLRPFAVKVRDRLYK